MDPLVTHKPDWTAVLIVAVVIALAFGFYLSDVGTSNEPPAPAMSTQACADLQYDFDTAAMHNDTAGFGSAGAQQSADRMSDLNSQMQDGGCYEP